MKGSKLITREQFDRLMHEVPANPDKVFAMIQRLCEMEREGGAASGVAALRGEMLSWAAKNRADDVELAKAILETEVDTADPMLTMMARAWTDLGKPEGPPIQE